MNKKIKKYRDLEYPYYSLYKKFVKKNILEYIKEYKSNILYYKPEEFKNKNFSKFLFNNKKKYFFIKDNFIKSLNINSITDYFTEHIRIKCKFGNNESPLDYWKKNKEYILNETLKKYNDINIHLLREIIYYKTKLCSNFRIVIAMSILDYFKPKTWLDISAGWGDRLLSAIFCKLELYVATDPNLDLHPSYDKIKKTFLTEKKRNNFIIHKNGFLEANIKESNFDICFTSPPFFTLEKYSNYNENSLSKFKTEKEWCDNFLIKSLIKAYNLLKENGHMILYMGGSEYVMKSMHKLDNIMKYKGIIYFYEKLPRAIYVWQKINNKIIYDL